MDQMDCSIIEAVRLRLFVCLLGIAALTGAAVGCGVGGDGDTTVLSAQETKQLLRQLPYRYTFRSVATPEGADAAVAGRAVGGHRTVLNFGIALGHGHYGVPVPKAGTEESYGYPRGGFIFTNDSLIKGPDGHLITNPILKTDTQWREAGHMEVTMTDKLCLAVTGEHCPP